MITALRRKMIRDLKALRAQAVTSGLLVACGVSLLVSMWSAYSSLQDSQTRYYRDYRFADVFAEIKRAPMDVAKKVARIPGVEVAEPRIVIDGLIEGDPSASDRTLAVGRFISVVPGEQPMLNQLHLRDGRLPTRSAETEAAVHEGFAKEQGLRVGDRLPVLIQGSRETVRIVGVVLSPEYVAELGPGAPFPDDRRFGVLWVARDGLERLAKMSDAFNSVSLRLTSGASPEDVKSRLDSLLRPFGCRGAYGRERQPSNRLLSDEIFGLKARAVITPGFFLGVAAFLIHVISSRLIGMQRAQIATLKAVGYSNAQVARHYLALIFAMMIGGAIPGILLGWLFGKGIYLSHQDIYRFPFSQYSMDAASVAIGPIAGVLPGLLGAWSSVRSAFQITPAEAMQPPAPPTFHATLFERLGLQARLSVRQRMAWRNLLLRKGRLTMTVLGLASALCLVVATFAWTDIIGTFLDTQFQRAQREDLSTTFMSPLPGSALQQLSRMRGVIAVEGYRMVPVRLRYLNHKREFMVAGWPRKATMRQLLDSRLKTIEVPYDGILLSRFFHDHWDIKAGDRVELEPLEGEPRRLSVPVAGFSDDFVGINGTMEIRELWSVLREQPGYNLATLLVDPAHEQRLYVDLQNLPEIASVQFKRDLYFGFERSVGRIMRFVSAILLVFALAIAMGVIYNSIRVSFSERSWELASLRVLGLDRSEAFGMLLSEVTMQVLLSLVPGCVMGYLLVRFIMTLANTETATFPTVIFAPTYATAVLTVLGGLGLSAIAVRGMMKRLSLVEALKARE